MLRIVGRGSLKELVDLALGGNLERRLRDWRAWGASHRWIARRLGEDLAAVGVRPVSRETVRRWLARLDDEEEKS